MFSQFGSAIRRGRGGWPAEEAGPAGRSRIMAEKVPPPSTKVIGDEVNL